jgi:hypothetical protein
MALYLYPPTSRYYGIDTALLTAADGRQVAYLRRRLVPPPEQFATLSLYVVQEGDRPDTVSASQLGDPLAFWRIADANAAIQPEAMTATPGSTLRITLPAGIPAMNTVNA